MDTAHTIKTPYMNTTTSIETGFWRTAGHSNGILTFGLWSNPLASPALGSEGSEATVSLETEGPLQDADCEKKLNKPTGADPDFQLMFVNAINR